MRQDTQKHYEVSEVFSGKSDEEHRALLQDIIDRYLVLQNQCAFPDQQG